jgi:hypothetical protein
MKAFQGDQYFQNIWGKTLGIARLVWREESDEKRSVRGTNWIGDRSSSIPKNCWPYTKTSENRPVQQRGTANSFLNMSGGLLAKNP